MVPSSARDFLGVAIDGTVYSRCGVGDERVPYWITGSLTESVAQPLLEDRRFNPGPAIITTCSERSPSGDFAF